MAPHKQSLANILFCLLPLATLPACAASEDTTSPCLASQTRQAATLDYVIDGDTLALADNRKVRILGINTPESHPSPQPKAHAASRAAENLLSGNSEIWLYKGVEALDRHGRALAHVVTTNGINLAEHLLLNGLAAATAVHPNTRCADRYQQLEMQARHKKLGLWSESHPWQIVDKRLSKKLDGFRLVTSNVSHVKSDRKYHHLALENGLRVTMTNTLASEIKAHKLTGHRMTVRGWIQWRKNKASLRLHHASNLQVHSD